MLPVHQKMLDQPPGNPKQKHDDRDPSGKLKYGRRPIDNWLASAWSLNWGPLNRWKAEGRLPENYCGSLQEISPAIEDEFENEDDLVAATF